MQTQQLRVAGVLPQAALEDRAGVIDIAAAQWKFGRLGKLSRINVRLASGARAERVRADYRGAAAAGRESHDAGRSERRSAAPVARLSIESHGARAGGVVHRRLLRLLDAVAGGVAAAARVRGAACARRDARSAARCSCSRAARSSARAARCSASMLGYRRGAHRARARSAAISAPATFAGSRPELEVRGWRNRSRSACSACWLRSSARCARRSKLRASPTASALKAGDVDERRSCARTAGCVAVLFAARRRWCCCCRRSPDCRCRATSSIALLLIGAVIAMPSIVRIRAASRAVSRARFRIRSRSRRSPARRATRRSACRRSS